MDIAILHSGDLEQVSIGGVDRYIKSIIEFSDNNEITVFGTCKYNEAQIGKKYIRQYHGKQYCFIPISDDRRKPLSLYYMLSEFKWLNVLCKYDCIFAQRTEYSIPFMFCKKGKEKLIQLIHGSSKYSEIGFGPKMAKIHLFLESLSVRIARKTFIILNRREFGVPYYKAKYRSCSDKFFYARNPINPSIFYKRNKSNCRIELGLNNEMPIIVFVGRVEHNPKRVLLFPDICRVLNEKGKRFQFVIVGNGNDLDSLKKKVNDNHLTEQFYFAGYVKDSLTISKYYCASDISINISMFEGTCTSNLEALATGIPIISTDVGDIGEVLDGFHNGIIIDNNENESELISSAVDAIISIWDNPPEMNNSFMKYSGEEVVCDLKKEIASL